jgi:phospholipid/cholesterol/gamma-HCH transport system substrate-binding protein
MKRNSTLFKSLVVLEHRALGVAFLVLCVLFTWFTYAVFTKQFTEYDEVTLKTSNVGLQLPALADVKIRGVIVGEVKETKVTSKGVDVTLGLFPESRDIIPANVTAQIVPKTLFGEKYVSLELPDYPSSTPIEPGATITQTDVAIEVERVLNDIYPLLRTVEPVQLNYTLTALANALEGRGDKLGENLETLDAYLKKINPEVPLLVEDLQKLGDVALVYSDVAPDLARILRNSVTTGNTLQEREAQLRALFTDVGAFASTSKDFLEANGENIIRLSDAGAAQLPVFARYAPEYPCLFNAMEDVIPREAEAFRNKTLNIVLEVLPSQPRGYGVQDDPQWNEDPGAFPLCDEYATIDKYGQKNLFPAEWVPEFNDGVDYPLYPSRVAPQMDLSSGYAGTRSEQAVINAILAKMMGVESDEVPGVATLLFGPLARGTEVTVR